MNHDALQSRLLEQLTTAIVVLDEKLRITQINSAAEALLSFSRSRHTSASLVDLLVDAEAMVAILMETLQTGQPHIQREAQLNILHGAEVIKNTVDYTVSCIEIDQENMLLLEIQPVNRLLRINRDASIFSAQQSSDAFLKGLAHEIKNPLGGIRGAAQLLEHELDSEDLIECTRIIIDEADRLRNLVNRMLSPSTSKELQQINIHEALERVRQLLEAEVGKKIVIFRDYDPSIPAIKADMDSLIQAVLNIARNAVQSLLQKGNESLYENKKRRIEILSRIVRHFTIGRKQHRLACRIDIIDNGPGIPDDIRDTIFMPMVSGHAENSGLGLAISQSIVSQHRGLITCRSEPGDTCFSIFLPLEE